MKKNYRYFYFQLYSTEGGIVIEIFIDFRFLMHIQVLGVLGNKKQVYMKWLSVRPCVCVSSLYRRNVYFVMNRTETNIQSMLWLCQVGQPLI